MTADASGTAQTPGLSSIAPFNRRYVGQLYALTRKNVILLWRARHSSMVRRVLGPLAVRSR